MAFCASAFLLQKNWLSFKTALFTDTTDVIIVRLLQVKEGSDWIFIYIFGCFISPRLEDLA